MQKTKNPLAIVIAIVLLDVLGVGILIPIIPLLLTDPAYTYHLHGLTQSQGFILLGLLTGIYPLMQFFATPLLGQLSDHVGRRPVLLFCLLGTALGYALFAIGIIYQNIPLLFLSRALDGITGGNIAVAQAVIADSTAPKQRARAFGLIGAAFGVGFIIGPFLGGTLSDPSLISWFNATTPFWFAAILSLVNAGVLYFLFGETLTTKSHSKFSFFQAFTNIKTAFSTSKYIRLFSVSFLFQGGFSFFTTFFGAYLIFRFGFNQSAIGNFFALVGIFIALTQGVVTPRVGKYFAHHTILSFSLLLVSATVYAYALVPQAWMLYLITAPMALGMGLSMANLTALISRSADDSRQGEVLGINASVQALAQSIPPVIAGFLAASTAPYMPILVGGFFVFTGWLVFIFFTQQTAKDIEAHAFISPS